MGAICKELVKAAARGLDKAGDGAQWAPLLLKRWGWEHPVSQRETLTCFREKRTAVLGTLRSYRAIAINCCGLIRSKALAEGMDFKKCAFHSNAITRNGFAQHAPRSRAYCLFLPSVSISLLTGLFLLFIAIPIRVNGISVHNKVSYATGPGGAAAISIITTNQPQVTKGIDYAEYKEHILLS